MEAITRISKTALIKKYKDKGLTKYNFDWYAELLGFETFPDPRGVVYSEEDFISKWNTPAKKITKQLLRA